MEKYVDYKKKLYIIILNFFENLDENHDEMHENSLKILAEIMKNQIEGDHEEMQQFLQIIKNICDNHHRDRYFIDNVNQIFNCFKKQIKQALSNIEIFNIFENNKLILLNLLQNDIITISEPIYQEMINKYKANCNYYSYFFYPELETFIGKKGFKNVKNKILSKYPDIFDNFDEKRQEGQNDSYICSLIRNDSVEEFISYINRNNYPLSSIIPPSIFETNSFLIENQDTTLIEYSAFFGSIQIFQYLLMNNVELKPSLWLYTIHSKNAELIHLLESNEIPPPKYKSKNDFKYINCLIECIKCHHNDFADYIENNLLDQNKDYLPKLKKITILKSIKYHNYAYFQTGSICKFGFFYLCLYNYNKLVDFLLIMKEEELKLKIIQ